MPRDQKKYIENIKKDAIAEIKNMWFILYVLMIILVYTVFKYFPDPTIETVSLIFLTLSGVIWKFDKKREDKTLIQIFERWFDTPILIIMTISLIALSNGNALLTIYTLWIAFCLIPIRFLIPTIFRSFDSFSKSKTPKQLILFYTVLSASIILFFSVLFIFSIPFEGNGIQKIPNHTDNSTVLNPTNSLDIVYFSAYLFFPISNLGNFVNIEPKGLSRTVVLFEVYLSYILHTFILSTLLLKFGNSGDSGKRDNKKVLNKRSAK